jgi:hypothetical protein
MMKLIRFKDGTFIWVKDGVNSPVLNKTEAVAYGTWVLKIARDEVMLGIDNLVANGTSFGKDNAAIFGDINRLYLYVAKFNGGCDEFSVPGQGSDFPGGV